MHTGWAILVGALLAVNAGTYLAYWTDKRRARKGLRRTPERTLHLWGLIGGWPAAFVAQRTLRHKTRDVRFQAVFALTIALWSAAIGVAVWLSIR